jgi:serine protease
MTELFCYYFIGIFDGKIGRRNKMARKLGLITIMGILILVSCLLLHQEVSAGERPYSKENEIIVSYRSNTTLERIEEIASHENAEVVYRSAFADFVTLRFDHRKMDMWKLIGGLESYGEIEFAEPNGIAYVFWTPNDPYFEYQWHFDNTHLNMEQAWDIERGGNSSIIVGILDTGVAYQTNLIPSYEQGEVSSSDGYYHISPDLMSTNFVEGYDFINSDTLPNDEHGHGTHCTGTVAQSTNNAKGVAGMAFNASIMPVRVLDEEGSGTCDKIADGISFAYQNGADVISMSLGGGPGDSVGYGVVHQAIINANNFGTVVIAAAGNSAVGQLSYPAAYEECIAVGATDIDDNLAPYSQWGDGIDVVAPGGDLYDTIPGTTYAAGVLQSTYWFLNEGGQLASVDSFGYTFLQGTSMATPHVAGLAALVISHGITGQSAVKQAIYTTCTDLGTPGYDLYFGHGLINPSLALGAEVLFTSMPILQNPYAQQFIDIWVVPKKPIYNDIPDTCRVTLDGTDTYLDFEKVAEQTYRTDFYFEQSGTATIYVTARDETTMTKGTISRQFSVTAITGDDGGIAESIDGIFSLSIPSHGSGTISWVVITDEQCQAGGDEYLALSRAYRCGPEGNTIATPSVIRIAFDTGLLSEYEAEDIGVYRVQGEEVTYIPTRIDEQHGYGFATISEFGSYVLLYAQGSGKSKPLDVNQLSISCYPNPVTSRFAYSYNVPSSATVDIALYDATGRRVKLIERNAFRTFGLHTGVCDLTGESLGAGVYFLRIGATMNTKTIENTKKVILLR